MSAEMLSKLSEFERNLILLARRTDGDWQRIAFELDRDPETCRAAFEAAKAKLSGKPAPASPPTAAPTPMKEATAVATPENTRSTTDVLGEALKELEQRREQLLPLVDELKQIDKAIATLRKATGQQAASTNGRATGRAVPDDLRQTIVGALRTDGPTARATIAKAVDQKEGPYLWGVLNKLEAAGDIVKVDGGYALPAAAKVA